MLKMGKRRKDKEPEEELGMNYLFSEKEELAPLSSTSRLAEETQNGFASMQANSRTSAKEPHIAASTSAKHMHMHPQEPDTAEKDGDEWEDLDSSEEVLDGGDTFQTDFQQRITNVDSRRMQENVTEKGKGQGNHQYGKGKGQHAPERVESGRFNSVCSQSMGKEVIPMHAIGRGGPARSMVVVSSVANPLKNAAAGFPKAKSMPQRTLASSTTTVLPKENLVGVIRQLGRDDDVPYPPPSLKFDYVPPEVFANVEGFDSLPELATASFPVVLPPPMFPSGVTISKETTEERTPVVLPPRVAKERPTYVPAFPDRQTGYMSDVRVPKAGPQAGLAQGISDLAVGSRGALGPQIPAATLATV